LINFSPAIPGLTVLDLTVLGLTVLGLTVLGLTVLGLTVLGLATFAPAADRGASAVFTMKPVIAFWRERVALDVLGGRINRFIRRMLAARVRVMRFSSEGASAEAEHGYALVLRTVERAAPT
jgi:hypothetical protein